MENQTVSQLNIQQGISNRTSRESERHEWCALARVIRLSRPLGNWEFLVWLLDIEKGAMQNAGTLPQTKLQNFPYVIENGVPKTGTD